MKYWLRGQVCHITCPTIQANPDPLAKFRAHSITAKGFVLKEQLEAAFPVFIMLHERLTLPAYPLAGVMVMT